MGHETGRDVIRIRGARQNNLKGFDLELPTRSLLVITGLSGSGKSSLAFDTLYAEGQRRYIETFSPYARQFFDRMDKPRVDAIEGIPPAIALEQRNSVRTTRSTVGTLTEICDHLKVLWPHLARLHCRVCGQPVVKEAPGDIWTRLLRPDTGLPGADVLVTFDLPLSAKLTLPEQLELVARQGFRRRLLIGVEVCRIEEAAPHLEGREATTLTVVQDRLNLLPANRSRFAEACEQAYHFGHGRLAVHGTATAATTAGGAPRTLVFSRHLHCAGCNLDYREPTSALFSFNHPIGACPACKGFGRIIAIDYDLAIPDHGKTLAGGAVRPWQTGLSAECQADLVRAARKAAVPLNVPFRDLSAEQQRWVIDGDPDYDPARDQASPHAWYGVKGYFRWLESKSYKMHVRVLLSRYRAYRTCPTCLGQRLQPDALLWRLPCPPPGGADRPPASEGLADATLTLADFYALTVRQSLDLVEQLAARHSTPAHDPVALALAEVQGRLRFLDDVGVGYLTLDRPTRTLSGGETQRVNLTTCLASRLVNTLFVLDEPSVGLHARDTDRLVRILLRLRDLGNTVVVVEHEAAVMRAADQIIDLGPGHGDAGGAVLAQLSYADLLEHPESLTGAYLSGRRRVIPPPGRPVHRGPSTIATPARPPALPTDGQLAEASLPFRTQSITDTPCLRLRGINRHNLHDLSVDIPLGRLVCFSGVSGSGKTTLASELLRLLRDRLEAAGTPAPTAGRDGLEVREGERSEGDAEEEVGELEGRTGATLEGADRLGALLLVDQSAIGRTPRSNPAVYSGAFDHVREVFAQSPTARERGLSASSFSFNSALGQCEQCRGAGFEKIEMQFLSDVFIRCPACNGRRYRPHLLEVRLLSTTAEGSARWPEGVSIADLLELTVDDALTFLAGFETRAARQAMERLRLVQEVGLGYLHLGQPINTLSGGEAQRLKLAGHLAESVAVAVETPTSRRANQPLPREPRPTLFVFDEPTTGLHFEDVGVLLQVFHRLVDAGHSVLIVEHHLDVLNSADWILDLGPEAGEDGGRVVVAGSPREVAACAASHTGRALSEHLGHGHALSPRQP